MLRLIAVPMMLLLCARSAAADEDAREHAKRLKNEGAQALDDGHARLGLERFTESYRVFPSPNMLFNIGLALDRLDRAAEALEYYEAFLTSSVDIQGAARTHASARTVELLPRVGHLMIRANLDGASVTVDGRPEGATPLVRPVHVDPGRHVVEANKLGYRGATQSAAVQAGQSLSLSLHLAAIEKPKRSWRRERIAGLTVGAFGIASLALGTTFAVLASSANHDLNHPTGLDTHYDPALEDRVKTDQALEGTFFAVGAVAVVVGTALTIVAWRRSRPGGL